MTDDTATPETGTGSYSEDDATAELLSRWNGTPDEAQPEDTEQEAPASEAADDNPEPEQPEGQAEGEEGEADDPDAEWEIEFGGQTRRLPKGLPEEVVREVQEFGQNLHRDYTRKTQEIAEVRKQAEAERASAQELMRITHEHADLVADMRFVQRQIEQISQTDLAALSESDPLAAQKQMVQLMQLQNAQQRIGAALHKSVSEMQAKHGAATKESLEKAQAELAREIKGWGEKRQTEIRQYAKTIGYSDEELAQVSDPRLVRLMHKAQQFDALHANKAAAMKKVKAKVLKPGAAGTTASINRANEQDAMKRLSRTGTTEAATEAILARMRARS